MNKPDFVARVARNAGMSTTQAATAVDVVFDELQRLMVEGDEYHQVGFGRFSVQTRAERQGMNPATQEMTTYPAKRVPKFTPGSSLKAAIAG